MSKLMRNFAGATAIALLPMAASAAVTVSSGGGPYDVLADAYEFNATFDVGTLGGSFTFDFFNDGSKNAAVTLIGGTVKQTTAKFDTGVQVDFGGEYTADIGAGETTGFGGSIVISPGETKTLEIVYGNTVNTGATGGDTDIDFSIEASEVPVPAAGLLLLTALGGSLALRRRKSNDA